MVKKGHEVYKNLQESGIFEAPGRRSAERKFINRTDGFLRSSSEKDSFGWRDGISQTNEPWRRYEERHSNTAGYWRRTNEKDSFGWRDGMNQNNEPWRRYGERH